jgi:hypothetical protein
MDIWISQDAWNFLTSWGTSSFLKRAVILRGDGIFAQKYIAKFSN